MLKLNKEFLEDFLITGRQILNECHRVSAKSLVLDFEKDKDKINDTLKQAIQVTIDKAKLLQAEDKKNPIKYITFSILLSGIITKDYSMSINLLDTKYFVDEVNVFNEWKLPYIADYIKENVEFGKQELMKQFVGVNDSDMYILEHNLTLLYFDKYIKYLNENIPIIVEKLEITDLKLEDEVDITCGFFLEYQKNVYIWEVLKP